MRQFISEVSAIAVLSVPIVLGCSNNDDRLPADPGQRESATTAQASGQPELEQPAAPKLASEAVAGQAPDFDSMIDALANRVNNPPYISGAGPGTIAIFGEDYDYAEQRRIRMATCDLNANVGNELWPRLMAHAADERYAFTFESGDGTMRNATIGLLCYIMAYGDVEYAFEQLAPLYNDDVRSPLVHLPWPAGESLSTWCESRKGKQLWELQIELCEKVIADPEALEDLSPQQRMEYVEKVKQRIDSIRKTRKPVVDKDRFPIADGSYTVLTDSDVERFRFRFEWPGLRFQSRAERDALLALFSNVSLEFADRTLKQIAEALEDASKQKVRLDAKALEAAGVRDDLRFSGTFRDVPLHTVLTTLLEPEHLDYEVLRNGRIIVTSLAALTSLTVAEQDEHIIYCIYYVFDVVADENELENLAKRFREACPAKSWKDEGGAGKLSANAADKKIYVYQTRSNIIRITQLLRDLRASRKKDPPK